MDDTNARQGPRGPMLDLAVHSHVVSPGMPDQVDGPPPDASLVIVVSCRSRLEAARRDRLLRELARAWTGELALIAEAMSASLLGGDAAWIPAPAPGPGSDDAPQARPGGEGVVARPVIEILDPADDALPPGVTLTLEVQDLGDASVGQRVSSMATFVERARRQMGDGARWREVEVHDRRSAASG